MFKKRRSRSSNSATAEVNLVPFIDLLSVCISFLLFTAVWLQAGVMSSKQGLGTEEQSKSENSQSLWIEMESAENLIVSTHGLAQNEKKTRIPSADLENFASSLKSKNPQLRTALVFPNMSSNYEDLIQTMDSLKKAEFIDIGISPL